MSFYISRSNLDEIKPHVCKIVQKSTGSENNSVITLIMNCIAAGYDVRKIAEKLCPMVEPDRASKIADHVHDVVTHVLYSNEEEDASDNKRGIDSEVDQKKRVRTEDNNGVLHSAKTNSTLLSEIQIKDMMANAQKMIEERKKALMALRANAVPGTQIGDTSEKANEPIEKQKKIQQLQMQIQSKLSSGVLKTVPAVKTVAATDKPAPLILDSEGRTIDITGKEVQLAHVTPTLKANIRARKREVFKQQLQEKPIEDLSESHFFDPRISLKPAARTKRALRFHEPGKFQQLAERMRMKAQLEKLQNEISQIAKKTGISSAAKLAQIAPKEDTQAEDIPDIEWWDSVILNEESYYGVDKEDEDAIKVSAITNLVEHPIQMKAPTDPLKPVYMPVFLTKKERKKLRRQNRREAWKEEQEKIRLGLEPPPEPKLRISNLMRVLGTEAVQDPTKMEAHVKAQMAKRVKAHEEANASRKLTPEQRKEKKIRKLQEDTTQGVNVTLYRVKDLTSPSKKFKIEKNAQQLFMTGCVIMFQDCNLVVVEGGPKQQSKFKKLMLHRIKWEEDMVRAKDGGGVSVPNKCTLVWEGMTKQRNFGEIKFKVCATEKLAREQLKKHNVEQYWDLVYSKTILDTSDEK